MYMLVNLSVLFLILIMIISMLICSTLKLWDYSKAKVSYLGIFNYKYILPGGGGGGGGEGGGGKLYIKIEGEE